MGTTSIEWTDFSVNPIRARLAGSDKTKGGYNSGVGHYCEKCSPGCALCYASAMQPRFGMPDFRGAGQKSTLDTLRSGVLPMGKTEVFFDDAVLQQVLRRRKPSKIFWCDMTDLFGSWVPFDWIDKCFAVMALTPWHTHQVLTKRPERMAQYMASANLANNIYRQITRWLDHDDGDILGCGRLWDSAHKTAEWRGDGRTVDSCKWVWPLPNVWLGTSVENQQCADDRIPHLLKCPAAVLFLSCEPLLGPVDLQRIPCRGAGFLDALDGRGHDGSSAASKDDSAGPSIGWVIVGGESGPGARRCDVPRIRSMVTQCQDSAVPCFVKQLGANPYDECPTGGVHRLHCEDKKGGDMSEWPTELRVRQMPKLS